MQQLSTQCTGICVAISFSLTACITSLSTSITKSLTTVGSPIQPDDSSVTIFLLERDIPKEIKRLGVATIIPTSQLAYGLDDRVKQQLKGECERSGANGAYRINDGTYSSLVVSYLIFKYDK